MKLTLKSLKSLLLLIILGSEYCHVQAMHNLNNASRDRLVKILYKNRLQKIQKRGIVFEGITAAAAAITPAVLAKSAPFIAVAGGLLSEVFRSHKSKHNDKDDSDSENEDSPSDEKNQHVFVPSDNRNEATNTHPDHDFLFTTPTHSTRPLENPSDKIITHTTPPVDQELRDALSKPFTPDEINAGLEELQETHSARTTKQPPQERKETGALYKTDKEAQVAAEAMGFEKTKEGRSKNCSVLEKDGMFISRDNTGHNGGVWKQVNKNLDRIATLDKDLNPIKD